MVGVRFGWDWSVPASKWWVSARDLGCLPQNGQNTLRFARFEANNFVWVPVPRLSPDCAGTAINNRHPQHQACIQSRLKPHHPPKSDRISDYRATSA